MRKSVFFVGMNITYIKFKDGPGNEQKLCNVNVVFVDSNFIEVDFRPSIGARKNTKYFKSIPLKSIIVADREEKE